jgi:KDO2-lipid IV(A) lauroyltransferase
MKAPRIKFLKHFWRRPPFDLLLYFVSRGLIMFIRMTPHPAPRPLVQGLSSLWRTLDGRHRKVVEENLRLAGYTLEKSTLVQDIYNHFTASLFETLTIPRLLKSGVTKPFVQIENPEILQKVGKKALLVAGHLGNWELAGIAVTHKGIPLTALARPIDNPYLDRWINEVRISTGLDLIPKTQAIRKMTQLLRKGGYLIIAVDQVPNPRSNGIHIPFFGRNALTVKTPAILSLKYDTPIVPLNIWRDEKGCHHFKFTEPILPADFKDEEDPIRAITEAFTNRLEKFIREHPEQWNWLHRRWKKGGDLPSPENDPSISETDPATIS